MDFKMIAKANEHATQLVKLKDFLAKTWKTKQTDIRLLIEVPRFDYDPNGDEVRLTVDVPLMPIRVMVNQEIARITKELSDLGVEFDPKPQSTGRGLESDV